MKDVARAKARAAAHYKPGARPRLPKLTDEQIMAIARGYVNAKDETPSVSELESIPAKFDRHRTVDYVDGHFRVIFRKQAYRRDRDRLHYFLWISLGWSRPRHSQADAKPIKLRQSKGGGS